MDGNSCDTGDEAISPVVNAHVKKVVAEKMELGPYNFPIANRLLDQEIQTIMDTQKPQLDRRYIDVFDNKPFKLTAKILVPSEQFPDVNFVGRLLGFRGERLKHLQEVTKCRMFILGKGSMKDKEKEQACMKTLDPKYAHLSDVLHVEITCLAPPEEAYSRMAKAISALQKLIRDDPSGSAQIEGAFNVNSNASVVSLVEKARQSMGSQPDTFRAYRQPLRNRGGRVRGAGNSLSTRAAPFPRRFENNTPPNYPN